MAPSNLGYSLREAGSHFFRNWTSSLGAVFTIFLSLFIIGLFIIGSAMITSVIGDIEQTVTITAFVSDEASDEDIQAFRDELETWDNVAHIDFKTKEDALEDYRATMSDHAEATISALDGENPLPRSFVIQMEDSSQVADTAERIKNDELFRKIVDDDDPEVDDVDADVDAGVIWGQEEVSVLFEVTGYIRIAAVVLVALLTFIAFIFINNTIRLSITATEGVIQAILGALLAVGALELMRNILVPTAQAALGSLFNITIPLDIYLVTYAALALVGVVIGLFGSAIAMRRYLKV